MTAGDKHAVKSRPRTAIIIQARHGSTRLPGKVLRKLAGKMVLEHVLTRCGSIAGIDRVVCATTDKPVDDVIAAEAQRLGVDVFRGDESDVLSRYLGAARQVDADIIMRVTSDCPLIDPEICADVLRLRQERDADYAANNMPRLFPHGLDCEAFTRAALEEAAAQATAPYDREHVTPWLRRHPKFRRANLTGPGWPANTYRWTLDYPEDYDFFASVFDAASPEQLAAMQPVLSLLVTRPDLAQINAGHAVAPDTTGRPTVVFRFDADQLIGTGHAMRCATLSSRFEEFGWRCYWAVSAATAAFLGSRLPQAQAIILQSDETEQQIKAIEAVAGSVGILVLDHYEIEKEFAMAARRIAQRIVAIDDLADRQLDADLVVNSTPGIEPAAYDALLTHPAKILIGGKAAPLRQQFAVARAGALQRRAAGVPALDRVLISFGGVDPLDGTSLATDVTASALPAASIEVVLGGGAPHIDKVAARVAELAASGRSIRLLRDVADMAGLMAGMDLCVGAPGTTTWERGCLALPSLLVGIAENQRPNAKVVAESGAGIVCGFLTTESRDQVRHQLTAALSGLVAEPQRLRQMTAKAAVLSDGRGVDRIILACPPAERLKDGAMLSLRLAEPADEGMLLDWQSAPETRRFALNSTVPTAAEHHAWYDAKLQSAADLLLYGCLGEEPVGYVRLDWRGDNRGSQIYLISVATAPGQYRRGIGQGMLQLARRLAPGATFLAQVLGGNKASETLFTGLGYRLQPDGYYWSEPN
ncbi:MAG: UDP-2,4-diacetamido-2,4,6-trideoxy-beta-L-altropyranose hydrolase [Dongiaceae bacterium]